MNRFAKILVSLIAIVVLVSFYPLLSAQATIFSAQEGLCLRNPATLTTEEKQEYDKANCAGFCEQVANKSDIKCQTEAQYGTQQAKESLKGTGVTHTETLGALIIKYVNFALPYLALAAFVGFVVAGFMYVTAYGNEEQLGKAKKILIWSIVGLLLVIASYSIVQFFTKGLVESLK